MSKLTNFCRFFFRLNVGFKIVQRKLIFGKLMSLTQSFSYIKIERTPRGTNEKDLKTENCKQEEFNGLEGRSCELETDTHVIQKLTNPK